MIFEQEAKVYKNNAIQNALDEVEASATQYNWHTETDTGAGAGTHITAIPKDDFLADPDNGGYNSLFDNIGMKIRNGLRTLASYGVSMVIGEDDGAKVEVDSDSVSMLTEDGVTAFSVESSMQTEAQEVTEELTNKISKNSTQTVTLSGLANVVNNTTVSLSFVYKYYNDGYAYGAFVSAIAGRNFTAGTASTITITYAEKASSTTVVRTITIAYNGADSFTITNPSPYFTLDLTKIKYTSQNAPIPQTQVNGLLSLNGVELTAPTLLTNVLSPYSGRCTIIDGGIVRIGKWRFVQVNVSIEDVSLSANNTWAILEGLANDLPATYGRDTGNNLAKRAALTASAQKNAGDISAYITDAGRIVVATSDYALTANDVVMISGWYLAE